MKKSLTLTITLTADEAEHPVEPYDLWRYADTLKILLMAGALSGASGLAVPHSHMGDPDCANYTGRWSVT